QKVPAEASGSEPFAVGAVEHTAYGQQIVVHRVRRPRRGNRSHGRATLAVDDNRPVARRCGDMFAVRTNRYAAETSVLAGGPGKLTGVATPLPVVPFPTA